MTRRKFAPAGLVLSALLGGCSGQSEQPLPVNRAQRTVVRENPARATADRSVENAKAASGVEAVASTDGAMWLVPPAGRAADIDGNTTRADLVRRFGHSSLRSAEINIGEGMTMTGSILFPDDSLRRIEIVWVDVKSTARPARLQVSGRKSLWTIAPGISLGTSLTEVERFNGGPLTLTGFDWDYGGVITGFRGGRLQYLKGKTPDVFLQLHPDPATSASSDQLRASVQGDREFGSEIAAMQRLNPRVHQMNISYEIR